MNIQIKTFPKYSGPSFEEISGYSCIAIRGPNASGKTYLAKLISNALDRKILSFADPLRDICSGILGIPEESLKEQGIKERQVRHGNNETVRDLLIDVATRIRKYDDKFFCKSLVNRAAGNFTIIDDLRFEIEEELLRETFGDSLLILDISNDS